MILAYQDPLQTANLGNHEKMHLVHYSSHRKRLQVVCGGGKMYQDLVVRKSISFAIWDTDSVNSYRVSPQNRPNPKISLS